MAPKKKLTKIPQMHTRTCRAHRTNGKEAKAISMKHTEENQTNREMVVWRPSGVQFLFDVSILTSDVAL